MPKFENQEEYEKWKAEALKRSNEEKQAQEEAEKLRLEEDERLSKLWICPECLNVNDNSLNKCQCGYVLDEKYSEYFKGNIKSTELYEIITDDDLNDDDKEVFLSFYLIKRFPETKEAGNIKKWMDDDSKKVVCGKCGSSSIYEPKYYKKDKCEKCGDFLYQYIKEDSNKSSFHKKPSFGLSSFYKSPKHVSIVLAVTAIVLVFLFSPYTSCSSKERIEKKFFKILDERVEVFNQRSSCKYIVSRYNIEKTSSIVSPYIGVAYYENYSTCGKRIEGERRERFAYQDGKWVVTQPYDY